MRRALVPALAASLLVLAGCTTTPERQATPLTDFTVDDLEPILSACLDEFDVADAHAVLVIDETSRHGLRVILTTASGDDVDVGIQAVVNDCLTRDPPDFTAENVTGTYNRSLLYEYYVTVQVPCLDAHGVGPTRLPSRTEFVSPDFDERGLFRLFSGGLGERLQILADCPAVPDYLVE